LNKIIIFSISLILISALLFPFLANSAFAQATYIFDMGPYYFLNFDGHDFVIPYNVHADIVKMQIDPESKSLLIGLNNTQDSEFFIGLKHKLISASNNKFVILVDGHEVEYKFIKTGHNDCDFASPTSTTAVKFFVPTGAKEVEIIGTHVFSNFSTIPPTTGDLPPKQQISNKILIEDIRSRLYQSDYQTYEIHFNDRKYDIPYHISGNNKIESMNLNSEFVPLSTSFLININSLEDGNLLIKIPYEFAKIPTSNHCYFPLIDRQESYFEQNYDAIPSLATYLSIPFKKANSEIEIIPVDKSREGCASTASKLVTQLGCGFTNEAIVCAEGFQKIFKKSNNFPVCVTHETSLNLIARGWGEK